MFTCTHPLDQKRLHNTCFKCSYKRWTSKSFGIPVKVLKKFNFALNYTWIPLKLIHLLYLCQFCHSISFQFFRVYEAYCKRYQRQNSNGVTVNVYHFFLSRVIKLGKMETNENEIFFNASDFKKFSILS